MNITCCPMCGDTDLEPRWKSLPEVLHCSTCELLFLGKFPEPPERKGYYQNEYYERGSGSRFLSPLEWVVRFFRERRAVDILRRLPPKRGGGPDAILDVGCGRGLLLESFRRRGWAVVGTQISETAKEACERQLDLPILCGELPDLKLTPGTYRAITFYHVLEHLDRPVDYLEKANHLLRPDGLLVVEVPDASAPGFRLLGPRDLCLDYPRHLFFFTPDSLKGMLRRSGFEVSAVSRFSIEYTPFTVLQNLLNLLPGKPNRLYRSFMRNAEGNRLRKSPLTWFHWILGGTLAPLAFLLSLSSLFLPFGNTLRVYCRKGAAVPANMLQMS